MSEVNLMRNWNKIGLLWNNADVLGCLLPNKGHDALAVNARRYLVETIEHW